MRFPTASCLLCRHSVLLKSSIAKRAVVCPSRAASSISAIHNGLRQSQKSRPQGFNRSSLETAKPDRPPRTTWVSHRKEAKNRSPPDFKIKKGKKDITYTGPEPQSRRARFHDPKKSFGKRSLVYQMKHGDLKEKMAEFESRESSDWAPSPRRTSTERLSSADFMKDFHASPGGAKNSARDKDRSKGRDSSVRGGQFAMQKSRTNTRDFDKGRPSPVPRKRFATQESPTSTKDFGNEHIKRADTSPPEPRREAIANAPSFAPRHKPYTSRSEQPGTSQRADEKDGRREEESRKVDDGPIRIHHTTAASQFLYGRSVVEAALRNSRRQLYKLYIYSGDDRRNLSQDDTLAKLAQQRGVRVTKVPNDGLRMMDKMSGGRPHNGCVLEASPLPQLPLKALGPISEDPKTPGFRVEIAHQSSEEGKINGTSDFVSYQLPKERKPFILLLDGILDPGNLGAILRTAAFLGVNGIAITKGSSATLTAVALKASAGAAEVTKLFSVSSTIDFLTRSKEHGWLVYAAVPSTNRSKGNSHLTVDRVETYDPLSLQPTVLVIGSEGEGLTKQVRRQADHEVSIPSPSGAFVSVVDSLNVSVATGILCAAFLKKQMMGVDDKLSEAENDDDSQLW
ncbi:hypothetical protein O1611_g4123 [Lasiodiplodia mahajangana]|uniref:Uncharacterized protein n=1 Tax=Lasiodiplodia mahajangana TaxID=1108764 RepID=A0ACC2JPW1_9PEZI|nr:hypothetical protein O1611_g4123 [Lasiodiplodia mahajangana]